MRQTAMTSELKTVTRAPFLPALDWGGRIVSGRQVFGAEVAAKYARIGVSDLSGASLIFLNQNAAQSLELGELIGIILRFMRQWNNRGRTEEPEMVTVHLRPQIDFYLQSLPAGEAASREVQRLWQQIRELDRAEQSLAGRSRTKTKRRELHHKRNLMDRMLQLRLRALAPKTNNSSQSNRGRGSTLGVTATATYLAYRTMATLHSGLEPDGQSPALVVGHTASRSGGRGQIKYISGRDAKLDERVPGVAPRPLPTLLLRLGRQAFWNQKLGRWAAGSGLFPAAANWPREAGAGAGNADHPAADLLMEGEAPRLIQKSTFNLAAPAVSPVTDVAAASKTKPAQARPKKSGKNKSRKKREEKPAPPILTPVSPGAAAVDRAPSPVATTPLPAVYGRAFFLWRLAASKFAQSPERSYARADGGLSGRHREAPEVQGDGPVPERLRTLTPAAGSEAKPGGFGFFHPTGRDYAAQINYYPISLRWRVHDLSGSGAGSRPRELNSPTAGRADDFAAPGTAERVRRGDTGDEPDDRGGNNARAGGSPWPETALPGTVREENKRIPAALRQWGKRLLKTIPEQWLPHVATEYVVLPRRFIFREDSALAERLNKNAVNLPPRSWSLDKNPDQLAGRTPARLYAVPATITSILRQTHWVASRRWTDIAARTPLTPGSKPSRSASGAAPEEFSSANLTLPLPGSLRLAPGLRRGATEPVLPGKRPDQLLRSGLSAWSGTAASGASHWKQGSKPPETGKQVDIWPRSTWWEARRWADFIPPNRRQREMERDDPATGKMMPPNSIADFSPILTPALSLEPRRAPGEQRAESAAASGTIWSKSAERARLFPATLRLFTSRLPARRREEEAARTAAGRSGVMLRGTAAADSKSERVMATVFPGTARNYTAGMPGAGVYPSISGPRLDLDHSFESRRRRPGTVGLDAVRWLGRIGPALLQPRVTGDLPRYYRPLRREIDRAEAAAGRGLLYREPGENKLLTLFSRNMFSTGTAAQGGPSARAGENAPRAGELQLRQPGRPEPSYRENQNVPYDTAAQIKLLHQQNVERETVLHEQTKTLQELARRLEQQNEAVRDLGSGAATKLGPSELHTITQEIMSRMEKELHLKKLRMGL